MTNHECLAALLERERHARQWTDEGVAAVILAHLGIDPNAIPESDVHKAEEAAADAAAKAKAARETFEAQAAHTTQPSAPGSAAANA